MNLLEILQSHAQAISIILGSLASVLLFWRRLQNKIIKIYNKHKNYTKSKHEIPETLKDIKYSISNIDNRLKNVEKEISFNGGSTMKDTLRIVKAEMEASFWLNPRPSFRTTSNGVNVLVNEAYCHLCGVSSESLLKLNWRNFADDEEQLDDYTRRWIESSKEFSQFSGKLKIKNYKNEYKGEWIIKIRPLGPIENNDKDDYLWHGSLYPFDKVALDYAKDQNIPAI
jgi:PAS domain-containing protein